MKGDYGRYYFKGKDGNIQFRKVNAKERLVLLQYYFRRRSGRILKIKNIAKAFHVSDRTIQADIKKLEKDRIIKRIPIYNNMGFQQGNKIMYTGSKERLNGKEPSIDKIFDERNPMKLRDFEWTDFWEYDDPLVFFMEIGRDYGTIDINSQVIRKHIDTPKE